MAVEENDVTIDAHGVASWDLNIFAPIGGTYMGHFKFRTVLSPLQEIEADRDYRDLLGKNAEFAATYVENFAYALAQLRQRVISAPPFWMDGISKFPGSQIRDKEVLEVVLEAAVTAEVKYRKSLSDKHKTAVERLAKALEKKEQEELDAKEANLKSQEEEASEEESKNL